MDKQNEIITCKNEKGETVQLPLDKFVSRPSVYAILRNEDRILVCRTRSNQNKLWFPGGGVEKEETNEEALRRECLEETGITKFEIRGLLGEFQNYFYYTPYDLAMDAQIFFYECATSEEKIHSNHEVNDEEAIDFKWMKISDIAAENFADLNDEIYELLRSLT